MAPTPHESILWALEARHARLRYVPLRKHSSLMLAGMNEAVLRFSILDCLETIELRLKERLERHLRAVSPGRWWEGLPRQVQSSAQQRHRWATRQIGRRRAGAAHSIVWLSMGDVIKALSTLGRAEWVKCLGAESSRPRAFARTLHRVKAFRDNRVAHPKPKPLSDHELVVLCRAVERIPAVLRPGEWRQTEDFLKRMRSLGSETGMELAVLGRHHSRQPEALRRWLACPEMDPPSVCRHSKRLRRADVRWRERIVCWCADIEAGGEVFFGRKE